jgi:serine/threonine-protein kinase
VTHLVPPSAASDRWIDQIIDGRYRVVERIGQGGMGVVYRVTHTRIGKVAAIKLLHSSLVSNEAAARRFHGEAEAISKLNHPNIVQVFDFGQAGDTVYLVMEHLAGEDLGAILNRDGRMSLARCIPIIAQVCDALSEAHGLGIVHRDLKPENIRVSRTQDGRDFVKVLDFGLAKIVESGTQAEITAQGALVGTPYYMAPEQIRGQTVDPRADIYSLGAVLYRILTGTQAFTAKTPMGVLTKHLTEEPAPPGQVAPGIGAKTDELVLKALAKRPEQRFADAQQLRSALVGLVTAADGVPLVDEAQLADTPQRRATDAGGSAPGEPVGSGALAELSADAALAELADTLPPAHQPSGMAPTGPGTSLPRIDGVDEVFERRLRWGRRLKLLAVVVALIGASVAAYWYGFRSAPTLLAPGEELEPNNGRDEATPLVAGSAVAGHVGRRISESESDRDWYRLQLRDGGRQQLMAQVSRIPNMDLTLELYDAVGGLLTRADSTTVGGDELITNWPLRAGVYYLVVRELWQVGQRPTENVTDPYQLVARWQPLTAGMEVEPNDRPKQANALVAGRPLKGYLGGIGDRDTFRLTGAGRYGGTLSAIEGVDLVLELVADGGRRQSIDDATVSGGETFEVEVERELLVVVRRRLEKKPAGGRSPGGRRAPYTLRVSRLGP